MITRLTVLFLIVLTNAFSMTIMAQIDNGKSLDKQLSPRVIGSITKRPKVVVFTTGGTIAEKVDPKTGGAVPAISGNDLIKAIPELTKVARIQVESICNIDSSQMKPETWKKLAQNVDLKLKDKDVQGAVITHGTDTMAEGAYFLYLTLKTSKPVVFVGAMRNASDLSPDGPANLLNAVKQVIKAQKLKWGVTVTVNQFINSAKYVRKVETTNLQAFNSGEAGYLGYITGNTLVVYNETPPKNPGLPLELPTTFPRVFLITTFAGDKGDFVKYAADNGAAGIVIEGVGAGNVNSDVFKMVKYAISKGVVVVITSRVPNGGVFPVYDDAGGGMALQKAGAILAGDLKGPKARLLLMLALANFKNDMDKVKAFFK